MSEYTYISFNAPQSAESPEQNRLEGMFFVALGKVLSIVIPKGLPDFESKIDDVKYWFVECETDTGTPQREIGFDANNIPIMKMPFKGNYGYWTDNNLWLDDFISLFNAVPIDGELFEEQWNLFDTITTIKF